MKAVDEYFLMVVVHIVAAWTQVMFLQMLRLIWTEKHGCERVEMTGEITPAVSGKPISVQMIMSLGEDIKLLTWSPNLYKPIQGLLKHSAHF